MRRNKDSKDRRQSPTPWSGGILPLRHSPHIGFYILSVFRPYSADNFKKKLKNIDYSMFFCNFVNGTTPVTAFPHFSSPKIHYINKFKNPENT